MPLDYSFEHTPNFRELTEAGLGLVRQPFTRSLCRLNALRAQLVAPAPVLVPVPVKSTKRFRRSL